MYEPQTGERVRAFHPLMFGVIMEGTVIGVGRKYIRIDFGSIRGGEFKVLRKDVVERA